MTSFPAKTSERPPEEPPYSLSHLTIIDVPTPELVGIAGRCGYDFVSPRLICAGLPGPDNSLSRNPDLLRQTRQALVQHELTLHDIELARIAEDADPLDYEVDLAIGAALGARCVLSSIWSTDRAFYIDSFGRLCRLAAQYGLSVNLEWVPIAGVATMAQAVDVLAQVGEPNARLAVDLHHFHRTRERVEDLDSLPGAWFDLVQVCDAPGEIPSDSEEMTRIIREARCYLGEGGTDPAGVLAHLPDVTYSIELPNAARVAAIGPEGHARRCLETTRRYLAGYDRSGWRRRASQQRRSTMTAR